MNYQNTAKLSKVDNWFKKAFIAHHAGKFEEAEALYRRVLQKTPSDMETLYLLGTACCQLGKHEDALRYLKKALTIAPNHPEALNNTGLAYKKQGREKEGIPYFRRALGLRPDYVDAMSNLGGALAETSEHAELNEAEQLLRRALELKPDLADAHYGLGLVLKKKDAFEEASRCFLTVLQIQPDYPEAYSDLGTIYKLWGRPEDALDCFERALALRPDFYMAQHNLGVALEELDRFEEAGAAYDRAMILDPDNLITRWNKAFFYLQQGILDKGWEAHEQRFNPKLAITLNRFPYPEWDGSSLKNKTILIYAEQGLGDEMLFASCFGDVIAMAKHCIIECEPRLATLFQRTFPTATVVGTVRDQIGWLLNMPKIDVQCAAGSLPRFVRPSLDSFPKKPDYLTPDPERLAYWRSRLTAIGPGLKVGICWRSSLRKGERKRLYSTLTQWGEIFKVPGVHFVNLQYDECTEELNEAERLFGVPVTVFPEIDLRNAIDDSAALTAACDVVISAATAVAEMAGAVGVETYRVDSFGAQWVSLGTDQMPWHPAMRLFAQTVHGDWETPLALVGKVLHDRALGIVDTTEYIALSHGVEIAVNGSPQDLSTYVLKEQRAWFDHEYGFVVKLAQQNLRMVDIGAGIGAYVLPMARRASAGRFWALTENAEETSLLFKSRTRNRLEKRVNIIKVEPDFILDAVLGQHGLGNISFVRIAPQTATPALFTGGTRFFTANSPLIMIGIAKGDKADAGILQWLTSCSYALYRYMPGVNMLVPLADMSELDSLSMNLFACKPDQAVVLEQKGFLISGGCALDDVPNAYRNDWQTYLQAMPYASSHIPVWTAMSQRVPGWEVYWMALHMFAMSKMRERAPAQRYAALQGAGNVLRALVQEQATLPRLLSLCRVLSDLGRRESALSLLNQICRLSDANPLNSMDEPCLPLDEEFSQKSFDGRVAAWTMSMILVHREMLRSPSSYFTGQDSLPILREVQACGLGDDGIARRIALISSRYMSQ